MKSWFALAVLLAGFVAAQSPTTSAEAPTTTDGIPVCVLTCSTQAAQSAGCSSFTDTSCVCTNTDFQTAAQQCLVESCTAEEQQAARGLQQALCGATSDTPSATAISTDPFSETATETETATDPGSAVTATPPTTSASGAVASATSRTASVISSLMPPASCTSSTAVAASSTAASNAAGLPAVLDLAAGGAWAVVALGGALVVQLAL